MNFKYFKTGKNDVSRRLDKVIRIFAENLSLPEIYKGIRKGLIKINDKKTKADYRIQEDDVIAIAQFLIENKNVETQINKNTKTSVNHLKMPQIVFENKDILIINKPYDVNVHGDDESLDKLIKEYYKNKNIDSSLSFTPGPLHRLDKKTTGLLAFSMSLEGARWFSENIKNHTIQKKYYGLVEGVISKTETWEDYISKDENDNKNFNTVKAAKEKTLDDEKKALTIVTPIQSGKFNNKAVTLVEFHIKTGRKHQIRSQSSLHKHPLLGDTAYNGQKINREQDFYLTAKELYFPKDNPIGLPEKLTVSLPKNFINILKYCEINRFSV